MVAIRASVSHELAYTRNRTSDIASSGSFSMSVSTITRGRSAARDAAAIPAAIIHAWSRASPVARMVVKGRGSFSGIELPKNHVVPAGPRR